MLNIEDLKKMKAGTVIYQASRNVVASMSFIAINSIVRQPDFWVNAGDGGFRLYGGMPTNLFLNLEEAEERAGKIHSDENQSRIEELQSQIDEIKDCLDIPVTKYLWDPVSPEKLEKAIDQARNPDDDGFVDVVYLND